MVPLLYTADDAKRLVNSAKFPPMGSRGFGSPFSMEKFGNISQVEYLQQANDALVVVVQIETKEALENVSKQQAAIVLQDALMNFWRLMKLPKLQASTVFS